MAAFVACGVRLWYARSQSTSPSDWRKHFGHTAREDATLAQRQNTFGRREGTADALWIATRLPGWSAYFGSTATDCSRLSELTAACGRARAWRGHGPWRRARDVVRHRFRYHQ